MKLIDILTRIDFGLGKTAVISCSNIDDIFFTLNELGIEEIEITKSEMHIITRFYLSNNGDKDPEKPKILQEGKIDKFLGVKLILI